MSESSEVLTSQELGHGVIREWLEEGHIMLLRMPNGAHREAIDVWFNTLIGTVEEWDKKQPFLVLHDCREMGFSYYFRERALEVAKLTPDDLSGRVAVVLSKGPIGYLMTMLAKLTSTKSTAKVSLKTSNDYDQALEWLKEGL